MSEKALKINKNIITLITKTGKKKKDRKMDRETNTSQFGF